jgi:glycosyltransferase involved in cell wall biosynthesis
MKVSVLICTHNPRPDYLRRVLRALKTQTLPKERWELFLIDNASNEPVERQFDLTWHPNGYHLREDKIGKINALLLGLAKHRGEIVVIVDDDNVLDSSYLELSLEIAQRLPNIGAWGGSIRGEFEIEPPEEIKPYLQGLAVLELTQDYWSNFPIWSLATPYGAGMCMRSQVAKVYWSQTINDPLKKSLGPSGSALGRKDDDDLAWTAIDLGMGNGRFKALKLTHLIPKERLTADYIVRLFAGFFGSGEVLEFVRNGRSFNQKKAWREWARLVVDYLQSRGVKRRIVVAAWQARRAARRVVAQTIHAGS